VSPQVQVSAEKLPRKDAKEKVRLFNKHCNRKSDKIRLEKLVRLNGLGISALDFNLGKINKKEL